MDNFRRNADVILCSSVPELAQGLHEDTGFYFQLCLTQIPRKNTDLPLAVSEMTAGAPAQSLQKFGLRRSTNRLRKVRAQPVSSWLRGGCSYMLYIIYCNITISYCLFLLIIYIIIITNIIARKRLVRQVR